MRVRSFNGSRAHLRIGLLTALSLACACLTLASVSASDRYGPFGPEGPRLREQLWILPSGEPDRPLRATVFRPAEAEDRSQESPRPLVVINHGTDELTRLSVAMPVYYWLSKWFVDRGYIVVLPQRRGHGATGGALTESIGTCAHPDHYASGIIAANDIESTIGFMTQQSFVRPTGTIVAGISTGGWASLALAARNPHGIEAIVNFAGGRGGHAYGVKNAVCGEQALLRAAHQYARTARVPTAWFYAENDSYFSPVLAEGLSRAWASAGGHVELHLLPPYGGEGHALAEDRAGWELWGSDLENFLNAQRERADGELHLSSSASQNAAPDDSAARSPAQ